MIELEQVENEMNNNNKMSLFVYVMSNGMWEQHILK